LNKCTSAKVVNMSRPLYEAKAEFFRTLGHPVRIRVLELLSERPHAVYELLAEIESEPSSLSHQLAVLRRTGLVDQERRGGDVVYSIAATEIRDLLRVARAVLLDVIDDRAQLRKALRDEAPIEA
jgi:DNA-binding transcriptional ArsR family regulator